MEGEFGGGNVIASAIVQIGVDDTALLRAEERIKAAVERLGNMGSGGGGGNTPSSSGGSTGIMSVSPNYGTISFVNPNSGSIGNAPNTGASAAMSGSGFGGAGQIDSAITQAVQTATQNAISSVNQQVSAAVSQYANGISGNASRGNRGYFPGYDDPNNLPGSTFSNNQRRTSNAMGSGNHSSFAYDDYLNGGRVYSMEQSGHHGQSNVARGGSAYVGEQYGFDNPRPMSMEQAGRRGNTNAVGRGNHASFHYDYDDINARPPVSMTQEGHEELPESEAPGNRFDLQRRRNQVNGGQYGGRNGVGGFGIYGAISRTLNVPYAGVIVAAMVAHEAYQAAEGIAVAHAQNDPAVAVGNLYNPGAGFDLSKDVLSTQNATAMTHNRIREQTLQAVPFGRMYDAMSGEMASRNKMNAEAEREIGIRNFLGESAFNQNIDLARTGGNEVEVARAVAARNIAPYQNAVNQMGDKTSRLALEKQTNINNNDIAFAQGVYNANIGAMQGNIGASVMQLGAQQEMGTSISRARDGDTVGAMSARMNSILAGGEAEEYAFGKQTDVLVAAERDPTKRSLLSQSRAAEASAMNQKHANAYSSAFGDFEQAGRDRASISYTTASIQATVDQDPLAAQTNSLQAQLTRLAPNDPNRGVVQAQMNAAPILYERQMHASAVMANAGLIQQAGAANRDLFAEVNSINQQISATYDNPDKNQGTLQRQTLQQQAVIAGVNARNSQRMEGEDYTAQAAASSEIMAYRPMSGSAVNDVARATRQVELSSQQNREGAINAARAGLRAKEFELTAQRGGETAIDMSAHQAAGAMVGRGIDLTGRRADLARAGQLYDAGANNLSQASLEKVPEGKGNIVNDPVVAALLAQLLAIAQGKGGGGYPN